MDEPNYRLTDASGNVIGDIGVDANGNPTVEHAASGESVSITEDGLVTQSLSTDDGTINTQLTATGNPSIRRQAEVTVADDTFTDLFQITECYSGILLIHAESAANTTHWRHKVVSIISIFGDSSANTIQEASKFSEINSITVGFTGLNQNTIQAKADEASGNDVEINAQWIGGHITSTQ